MIARQLTAEQRITLRNNMEEIERQIQIEGGFTWQQLEQEMSQARADSETPERVDAVLTNQSTICKE